MNARKAIVILGCVVAVLIVALIAVCLFAVKKLESEKNTAKTAKARETRWARKDEAQTQTETVPPNDVTELKESVQMNITTNDSQEQKAS